MAILQAGPILTPEERLARRRLILRDAVSLLTLFLITAVLFALTYLLFQSFDTHRRELGQRWKARGEKALQSGHPVVAIEALRDALGYTPSRDTEIELATALADSGKIQEANAYFNTLREASPGDGMINLQLARLAARQGNHQLAVLRYQDALDGTWQGNGYNLRREVRLELARYLIASRDFTGARNQLLIAASNAPDESGIKLEIAALLNQANAPQDALGIYRNVAAGHNAPVQAVEGAGQTAFHLGYYRMAADFLNRAVNSPAAASLGSGDLTSDRAMLQASQRILLLYPSFNMAALPRAQRILADRDVARQRVSNCVAANANAPAQLAALVARWDQIPPRLTARKLAQQPDLEQNILQLIYDTETTTAQVCGPPTGDDALLLRIARNPYAVEQE